MWSPQNPFAKPENLQEPLDLLLAMLSQSCVCVNVSVLVSVWVCVCVCVCGEMMLWCDGVAVSENLSIYIAPLSLSSPHNTIAHSVNGSFTFIL